jgi:hypothetical protein
LGLTWDFARNFEINSLYSGTAARDRKAYRKGLGSPSLLRRENAKAEALAYLEATAGTTTRAIARTTATVEGKILRDFNQRDDFGLCAGL